jgi:hypothetical protein
MWKDNRKNGVGCYINKSGVKYEGLFENDQKHGFGIETFSDGKYQGYFIKGKRHGEGFYQYYDEKDVIIYKQVFENNILISETEMLKEEPKLQIPKELIAEGYEEEMKKLSEIELSENDIEDISKLMTGFVTIKKKNFKNLINKLEAKLHNSVQKDLLNKILEKKFLDEYALLQLNSDLEKYEQLSKFKDIENLEAIKECLKSIGIVTETNNLLIAKMKLKAYLNMFEVIIKNGEKIKGSKYLSENDYNLIYKKLEIK